MEKELLEVLEKASKNWEDYIETKYHPSNEDYKNLEIVDALISVLRGY